MIVSGVILYCHVTFLSRDGTPVTRDLAHFFTRAYDTLVHLTDSFVGIRMIVGRMSAIEAGPQNIKPQQ